LADLHRGGRVGACRMPPRRAVSLALVLATASAVTDLQCQIFDETLVCDNERGRLSRAEIRTCSG